MGYLVAHALRSIHPRRPITLITHKTAIAKTFESRGGLITVEKNRLAISRRGFDMEVSNMALEHLLPYAQPQIRLKEEEKIEHLIVTSRGHQAKYAIKPLVKRLSRSSTVAFVQNSMGVVEEINALYFPDPDKRPTYIIGAHTYSVTSPAGPGFEPFRVILAGTGTGTLKLAVTLPPTTKLPPANPTAIPPPASLPPTTNYLLTSLISSLDLAATHVSPQEVLAQQLERLAVNAVINPLTVVFDCQNGALLHNPHATKVIKLLLYEISRVICALPELQQLPTKDVRFSVENLYAMVVKVARYTGEKTSDMLQEIRKGIPTEIDYVNGWVVRRGQELGIRSTVNFMVQAMVKAKEKMMSVQRERELPVEGIDSQESSEQL